jgi:putative DNA primase/helicase
VNFEPLFTTEQYEEARAPEFSDESLALRFAGLHATDLRYVASWSKWLSWTGKVWRFDETLATLDLVRRVCRAAASECNTHKVAKDIASAKTVAAVERLARADRRLAANVEQWDADLWLLNTPDGCVDLRTATIRPHNAEDYMTKITGAGPGGECPKFRAFLARITSNDVGLQAYLRRVFGYALTGLTKEHALFFAYGTGANGKSVLVSTIGGVLGNYHVTAPAEMFTTGSAERHPTEVARLRGARLVTATETEEGRRWAESRIKTLTGGDVIAARFMRQDFFEFTPVFKLLIAGNHKPSLRSVDEAIRRRLHLIPFRVTIPPEERDKDLAEKLRGEWPGIIAWLVEGAREWLLKGLEPPSAVVEATEAYIQAEDAFAAWIEECCDVGPGAMAQPNPLFLSWVEWARRSGEEPGSAKRFWETLAKRGFEATKSNGVRRYRGIKLKESDQWDGPGSDRVGSLV